jgi:hypothetical protein
VEDTELIRLILSGCFNDSTTTGRIFEPCCGTLRLLPVYMDMGMQVTAVDASEYLIDLAQ